MSKVLIWLITNGVKFKLNIRFALSPKLGDTSGTDRQIGLDEDLHDFCLSLKLFSIPQLSMKNLNEEN